MTTMKECILTNDQGQPMALGSRNQMTRFLKHDCVDGMYAIVGPDIDMTYYRIGGVVYPCGGTQDGVKMPPRSKDECKQVFGTYGVNHE